MAWHFDIRTGVIVCAVLALLIDGLLLAVYRSLPASYRPSLRWWLAAHRQEYAEQAEREGFEASEALELVLEYFDLVWPQAHAPEGLAGH